jgi:formate hydrogenlyase subunit 3/multisubunit Na+/H+ antiporter MnhD subunit
MGLILAFIAVVFLSVTSTPFVNVNRKGIIAVTAVVLIAILSSIIAFGALAGKNFEYVFTGSSVTGAIPVRIDALSGWFIVIINFTCITGAFYGMQYLKPYRTQKSNLSLHCIAYILMQSGLISVCALQNTLVFLTGWEIMALSCFILIIFEYHKRETLNAGINFLIQSHIGIMFLTLGFIWVATQTGSYDFKAISLFSGAHSLLTGVALFLCFFFGFAVKAGFVPFHTWLPYAHPASPSHISGVMSGVIIKIGIYGIMRMLLVVNTDYLVVGYILLFISIATGIYGVMLAIIQHNLKTLLAYHSIENIGIIGIGIGLGCIGIGTANHLLTVLGFAGALLHTLNHSLFKSLLFYGAGNVYQSAHTMDIEKLGGLGKQLPQTAFLFLTAALAICGLPPFNGFVSEFLIYKGMFSGLQTQDTALILSVIFGIFGLALIGGLAMLCFTKAFGSVFSGTPRFDFHHKPVEANFGKLIPMYAVFVLIMAIGLFPKIFVMALAEPVHLFTRYSDHYIPAASLPGTSAVSMIGLCSAAFLGLAGLIFWLKKRITGSRPQTIDVTWACGYAVPSAKMQYTASSFVRAYRKLAEPIFSVHKKKKEIRGIFPKSGGQETHPYDKLEEWLIDYPLQRLRKFLSRFIFLQNGNLQFYILYGAIFITLALIIPFAFDYIKAVIKFLNQI